jgi:hypothetical protein
MVELKKPRNNKELEEYWFHQKPIDDALIWEG